jgi:RNA polymerase sigma factor (sigma-70 family)
MTEFSRGEDCSQATLPELVSAALSGDRGAWNSLVDRFAPLVRAVISRFRLTIADADDVSQNVWLSLVEHLKDIRDPRALPGWIVTTTKNEALRVLSAQRRTQPVDPQADNHFERVDHTDVAENILRLERRQAVRSGLADLVPKQRDLLLLILQDPEISYLKISEELGIPTGSIGPTRGRSLERLQATTAIRALAS